MPATSQAQFKAMQAAKHGKSTLGIPKKVGAEFISGQSPKGLPARAGAKNAHGTSAKHSATNHKAALRKQTAIGHSGNHGGHSLAMHAKVKAGLKKAFPS